MHGTADVSLIEIEPLLSGRRTTPDYIAEATRRAINSGRLPDGATINQAELAARFGVSRVPVREALRQLQAEGLVELRVHHLAVVRGMDVERLIEVFSVRALLEGWVIEQAASRIDATILDAAREINERLRNEDDHVKWLELNAEFHALLYSRSGAKTAMEMLDSLRSRSERYTRLWSHGLGVHRPEETVAEHAHIIDLLAQGDGVGARAAVEAHVLHTRDRVVEAGRKFKAGGE
ncbi:MAG TPA: GntR family transcriptional regulator [Trebonia sp.]|jgi:DNA-binding GntR family transcriptional regulator|nr:GntR family transcriptional regulator [Trebonia sp.]